MLQRDLRKTLLVAQVVGFATLARSVAYDFWFTIAISSLMILGTFAAVRNRTWGVVLSFAAASTFTCAALLGIAPPWFLAVGAVGALPYFITSEAMSRLDRQATAVLTAVSAGVGGLAAIVWASIAWNVFVAFPALAPSRIACNGLAVATVLALGVIAAVAQRDRQARQRVAEPEPLQQRGLRFAEGLAIEPSAARDDAEAEAEAGSHDEPRARLRS